MIHHLRRSWFWLRYRSHGIRIGRARLSWQCRQTGQTPAGWFGDWDCGGIAFVDCHAWLVILSASYCHTDYPPQTVGERGVW